MELKVLGPGCANCERLEEITHKAVELVGIEANIIKVSDYNEILESGILTTPGLIINGKVVCSGRVPSVDEVCEWITKQES